jgi:peptidyl-prolyl cis-trans isomerase C
MQMQTDTTRTRRHEETLRRTKADLTSTLSMVLLWPSAINNRGKIGGVLKDLTGRELLRVSPCAWLVRLFVIAVFGAAVLGLTAHGFAQTQTKRAATPAKSAPAPPQTSPSKEAHKEAPEEEQVLAAPPGALFPAVVARVNGKAILGRDLEQRIQAQLAPIGNPKWNNLREEYRQELISQSLGALIGTELVYQKAQAGGIKASEPEIQAELAKLAKNFGGDAEMNAALANRGLDPAGLTRELEKSLTVAKFVQETIAGKTTITPAELSQYYEQHKEEFRHPDLVRTSHILILVKEGATQEQETMAKQRAEAILERVKKGEDFSKLARENSMDPASATQGGDVGLVPKGQLAREYEEVAFSLPAGGISDVVRTQFGFHIIKVTEKKKEGLATLDEARAELTEFLKRQKTDQDLGKLVNELRTQAKISVYLTGPATASSPRP